MISISQIHQLFKKYSELIDLEILEFGVKPTEVRHLIGRLGEFYCAIKVNGSLAHTSNQHGFDVICDKGRRISVKTTAQKTGFISISKSTLNQVDDLMIIQYFDGALSTVYYGPIDQAVVVARYYPPSGKFELDISKARKLQHALQ
jgi:hypothetical protein